MSSDPLDRKVLAQDRPQYEQSVKAARQRRNKEIAAENERLSKQYELDLAEYNKQEEANRKAQEDYDRQVAEYEKAKAAAEAKSEERKALEKTYANQLAELEATKANLINTIPFYESIYDKNTRTFVEKPIDKSQRQTMINAAARSINTQITSVQHEATSKLNQYDFSQKYPTAVLGGTVRDQFKASLGQESLISLYEKFNESKAQEAEWKRKTSIQQAQNAPRYTDLQRSAIESEHVGNLFTPSPQTQAAIARAEKIKPTLPPSGTIFPTTPTMAEKQRRPLINVETGNYISGEWKPNNPVALVAGLSKQQVKEGVQIANTKTEEPVKIESTVTDINTTKSFEPVNLISPYIREGSQKNPMRGKQPDQTLVSPFLKNKKQESFKVYFSPNTPEEIKINPIRSNTPEGPPSPKESFLEGLTRPITNFASESLDFILAVGNNDLTSPKPFTDPNNPFGLPVPRQKTPTKPTASSELLQGRTSKLTEPAILGSALTEGALLITGLKVPKIFPKSKPSIGKVPDSPKIESKIYPPKERLTPELVNKPITKNTSFTIENINLGRGIADVPKPVKVVQPDPFYKPATRANEIDVPFGDLTGFKSTKINLGSATAETPNIKGTFAKKEPVQPDVYYRPSNRANEINIPFGELVDFKSTKINLGKGTAPTPPIRGKLPEPVKPDPFYRPTTRPNEIDMNDFTLSEFKYSTVKLGKGTVRPSDVLLKGKQTKPIEQDPFYTPSKRANEIDYTDKDDAIKIPKIEMEKSEIQLDLKRELKRLKRKNPIFKTDEIKFRGKGMEIKSGKQNLVLIQKAEVATIKKLKTKRQTPVNTNWSEKIETAKLPQTGRSPTSSLLITIPKKEQKRKPYFRESSGVAVFEIPLHAQRPVIQQRERIITRSIQTPKVEAKLRSDNAIKFFQPQKLSYSVTPKLTTRQRERVDTFEKIKTSQVIKPKQIEKQAQKQATPEPLKFPSRLAQPAKLKQPTRQVFKFARPEPPRPPRTRMGGLLPPKESKIPKSVKQKQKARMDFLGSSSETQIGGLFKRQEITYGDKKISRLLQGDKRVVKGKSRTVRTSRAKFDLLGFKTKKGKAKKDTEFW